MRAHGRHVLVVTVDADAAHPVGGQPQDVVDALAHVHGLEVLGVRARVALQGLGQLDDTVTRGEHRAQGPAQARPGLVGVDAARDLRERARTVRPLDPRAHEATRERAVANDRQELLHEGALDRRGARGRGEGAGHRLPRRGRGRCRERGVDVLVQVLSCAHEGGHRVVELVGDAGAQLTEHRETRAFDQLGACGAQVLEGGGQGLLLGLEILGEHRVLQVEVLGAHEATRQRADRERRQRRTNRRVLGDDDLELLGRQAHERRLGRRLTRKERVLRAGQRHEADERARRRQVRQDLALRRVPVQRHLAIQHQVDGAHRLALGHQLRPLGDNQPRPLPEHALNAGEELHDNLALVTVQALQEWALHGERRRIGDERTDLPVRVAAPAQVAHHRRIGLARQEGNRPRGLQDRGERAGLHAPGQVSVLGLIRHHHPLHALQRREAPRTVDEPVNIIDLGGHQAHEHVVAHIQAGLVAGQVLDPVNAVQAQTREGMRQVPRHGRGDRPRVVAHDQHVNRVASSVPAAAHVRASQHRGVLRRRPLRPPVGQPRPGAQRPRTDHGLVPGHVTSPR